MKWSVIGLLLMGCSGEKSGGGDATEDTAGPEDGAPPVSSFVQGQYKATTFAILEAGEGLDVYGVDDDPEADGEVDNHLPNVLPTINAFASQDFSLEGLNGSIADSLVSEDLIMLMELIHADGALTMDMLLGERDSGGALGVDASSYGADGNPQARLTGAFTDETDFDATADRVEIPVIFDVEKPPVLLPLAVAIVQGSVQEENSVGLLGGIIPVVDLVDQVIEPLLPSEEEYDPADYLNLSRDDLLDTILELAENEGIADKELPDGTRGVSAGLSYFAAATSW